MTTMFTLDELNLAAETKAIENAITLSLLSQEWKHVLFTTRQIKRGLVSLLENLNGDALVASVPDVLNTNTLEKLEPFNRFDMPASTRIAVEFINEMACNDATIAYAIEHIQTDLEELIIKHWEDTFRSEDHAVDWLIHVDMTFNADGSIASYDEIIEEEQNYKVNWEVNGKAVSLNLKTTHSLLPIAEALTTVFNWVKNENSLNIDGVMKLLIDLKTHGQITTPKSEIVILKKSDIAICVNDQKTDHYLQDLLGYVADCLSFSDNVDNFVGNELFTKLSTLDQQLANFLNFAQDLYIHDNACDVNTVKKEDLMIFSEYY